MPYSIVQHFILFFPLLGSTTCSRSLPLSSRPLVLKTNSAEAEAFATSPDVQGITSLVATHVLRQHTFPLFVVTVLYVALYVAFKIVGDPLLALVKVMSRLYV